MARTSLVRAGSTTGAFTTNDHSDPFGVDPWLDLIDGQNTNGPIRIPSVDGNF